MASANHHPPDFSTIIPDTHRTNFTLKGMDKFGGVPTGWTEDTCAGLDATGVADATSGINACITAAAPNRVVFIPAGIYRVDGNINMKSNVILRGAGVGHPWMPNAPGAGHTQLNLNTARVSFNGGNKTSNWTPGAGAQNNITLGYAKEATNLTLASIVGYTVGQVVAIFEQNDPAHVTPGETFACEDNGAGARCLTQYSEITAINGNVITIDPPISLVLGGGNPGVRRQSFNIVNAGIENMKIRGDGTDRILHLEFVRKVWVRNVETYNSGNNNSEPHIWVRFSDYVDIWGNHLHHGANHNSGVAYGIELIHWNSNHKIENNVIQSTRHGIVAEGMSNSVVLYNYDVDAWEGGNTSFVTKSCLVNHLAWPHMNLWEGNDCQRLEADNTHGNSGYNTLFRNWGEGHRPRHTADVPAYTTSGLSAIDVAAFQRNYSLVGNVAGLPSWTTGTSICNGANGSGGCPTTTRPFGYEFGRQSNESFADSQARSTANFCGNYDYIADGLTSGISCPISIPTSLYHSVKPDYFGNVRWPPIGPDATGITNNIPAKQCYLENKMPNCLVGTALPRVLTVAIVGTGSVVASPTGISCPGDCAEQYPDGTVVTLTYTAGSGFVFTGWSGAGVSCPGLGSCQVTLTADLTVTATFVDAGSGPQIGACVAGTNASGTSHTVNLPAGITSGQILQIAFANDAASTVTWPGGYTEVVSIVCPFNTCRLSVGVRWTDGTEGASISVTTSAARTSAYTACRITGAENISVRPVEFSQPATGVSSAPNPLAVTPTDGPKSYLFMAVMASQSNTSSPTGPAGYSNLTSAANVGGSPTAASAGRTFITLTEDPGPYTIDGDFRWASVVLAYHPPIPPSVNPVVVSITGAVVSGEAVTIVGTDFGASQGAGGTFVTNLSTWPGGTSCAQVEGGWAATSIPITFGLCSFSDFVGKYLYVVRDDGVFNPIGFLLHVPGTSEPSIFTRPTVTSSPMVTTRPVQ
jgi:hypothetical protein